MKIFTLPLAIVAAIGLFSNVSAATLIGTEPATKPAEDADILEAMKAYASLTEINASLKKKVAENPLKEKDFLKLAPELNLLKYFRILSVEVFPQALIPDTDEIEVLSILAEEEIFQRDKNSNHQLIPFFEFMLVDSQRRTVSDYLVLKKSDWNKDERAEKLAVLQEERNNSASTYGHALYAIGEEAIPSIEKLSSDLLKENIPQLGFALSQLSKTIKSAEYKEYAELRSEISKKAKENPEDPSSPPKIQQILKRELQAFKEPPGKKGKFTFASGFLPGFKADKLF